MGIGSLIIENIFGTINYFIEESKKPSTPPVRHTTFRFWFWTANLIAGLVFTMLQLLAAAIGTPLFIGLFSPIFAILAMLGWASFFCLPFIVVMTYLVIKLASGNLLLKRITVGFFMLGIEIIILILLVSNFGQTLSNSLSEPLIYCFFCLITVLSEYYLLSGFESFLLRAH